MKFLTAKWPYYLSASFLAFIFVLVLFLLDAPLGMTDAYISLSEYCRSALENSSLGDSITLDWQTGFLLGVFFGALAAVIAGKEWKFLFFPEDRKNKKFFSSCLITPVQGITGGFLVMAGLQLAGDSFVGQWVAAIQLSTAAWIFLPMTAIAGFPVTLLADFYVGKSGGSAPDKTKK